MSKNTESPKRGKQQTPVSRKDQPPTQKKAGSEGDQSKYQYLYPLPQARSTKESASDEKPLPPVPNRSGKWALIDPSISADDPRHSTTSGSSKQSVPLQIETDTVPEFLQPIVAIKKRRVFWIVGTVIWSITVIMLTFILGRAAIEMIAPDMGADSVARVLILLAGVTGIFSAMIPSTIYRRQLDNARESVLKQMVDRKQVSQLDSFLQI